MFTSFLRKTFAQLFRIELAFNFLSDFFTLDFFWVTFWVNCAQSEAKSVAKIKWLWVMTVPSPCSVVVNVNDCHRKGRRFELFTVPKFVHQKLSLAYVPSDLYASPNSSSSDFNQVMFFKCQRCACPHVESKGLGQIAEQNSRSDLKNCIFDNLIRSGVGGIIKTRFCSKKFLIKNFSTGL